VTVDREQPHEVGSALVTGASRGIGAAIATAIARDGWRIGVNYREDESGAEKVVSRINDAGGEAVPLRADVGDPDASEAMLAELAEMWGPVLVLVNNAGTRADALIAQIGDESWEGVMETNLTASFRLIRRAVGPMLRARFGRIVTVSSVAALRGNPGQSSYAASKAGLIGLSRTVATEVARRGVTVNVIAPGLIDTELIAGHAEGLLDAIPAKRMGNPEEVAACARFLVSRGASYVTGSTLTVDGGLTA
jgi:3-oxoacyl-[acyl-carrier protein] reductase